METMSAADSEVDIDALSRMVSFGSAGDLTQAELSELAKSVGTDDIFGPEEVSEGRQQMVTDIEASPPHELADIVAGSRTPETISYGSGGDPDRSSGGASPSRSGERCWASMFDHECLRCSEGSGEKLIDKFCSVCRTTGVRVAAERVRALLPEQYDRFANSRKEGFWTEGSGTTPRFRVVNHTKECTGAWLVLFEKEPVGVPVNWAPMPPDWLESVDYMRLWLSKSTMVPRQPRLGLGVVFTMHCGAAAAKPDPSPCPHPHPNQVPRQPRQKLKRKGAATDTQPAPVPPPLRAIALPMSSPLGPQPHDMTPLLDMSELLMGDSAHGTQVRPGPRTLAPNPNPNPNPDPNPRHPNPNQAPAYRSQLATAETVTARVAAQRWTARSC